jgi:hypothetical protein
MQILSNISSTIKSVTFILLLLLATYSPAFAQKNLLDLTNIQSREDLVALRAQLSHDTSAKKWPYSTRIDSALWNKVLVKDIAITDVDLQMEIKPEQLGSSKILVEILKRRYKDELIIKADWRDRKYLVHTASTDIELSMRIKEDEEIQAATASTLSIAFKPSFNAAYPSLALNADKKPNGIFYRLELDYNGSNIEVFVNGISVFDGLARARYMNEEVLDLNPFILGKENVTLKIKLTPGLDETGKPFPSIQKQSYATAELQKGTYKNGEFQLLSTDKFCKYAEYVTDTIREDKETRYSSYLGTYQYGGKQLEAKTTFMADVSYEAKGWKDGNDLHNDKQLKEKVSHLYQQLASIIQNKDDAALSKLFLQMGTEQLAYQYGQKPGDITDQWNIWMKAMDKTNIIKVAPDFDLQISEDGKLIYAVPTMQSHMLRAIGKETAIGFSQYMYEDKTSNELKFIR